MASKILLGWEEWCALPELKIPAIKAKVDTGATTSALHAYDIKVIEKKGVQYVKFWMHPLQQNEVVKIPCVAKLHGQRKVMSSNGHLEKRYLIRTPVQINGKIWDIDMTLTRRDSLSFRMLLGRKALSGKAMIDPSKSFAQGKMTDREARKKYS